MNDPKKWCLICGDHTHEVGECNPTVREDRTWSARTHALQSTPAAPPVAEDADALLDALVGAVDSLAWHEHGGEDTESMRSRVTVARAKCLARMMPLVPLGEQVTAILREADAMAAKRAQVIPCPTAESLWDHISANTYAVDDSVGTYADQYRTVSIEHVRAALAALTGGGK